MTYLPLVRIEVITWSGQVTPLSKLTCSDRQGQHVVSPPVDAVSNVGGCEHRGMTGDQFSGMQTRLGDGPAWSFRKPLHPELPRVAAGCYTIWDDGGRFIYAGMAGRNLTAEKIRDARANPRAQVSGLRDRLRAHRTGRRSGDQFSVYVFDRFILGALSADAVSAAVAGKRRLDDDVRAFIQSRLSYRWVETESGAEAFALEATLVTEGLGGSLPYLNPRQPEEA